MDCLHACLPASVPPALVFLGAMLTLLWTQQGAVEGPWGEGGAPAAHPASKTTG